MGIRWSKSELDRGILVLSAAFAACALLVLRLGAAGGASSTLRSALDSAGATLRLDCQDPPSPRVWVRCDAAFGDRRLSLRAKLLDRAKNLGSLVLRLKEREKLVGEREADNWILIPAEGAGGGARLALAHALFARVEPELELPPVRLYPVRVDGAEPRVMGLVPRVSRHSFGYLSFRDALTPSARIFRIDWKSEGRSATFRQVFPDPKRSGFPARGEMEAVLERLRGPGWSEPVEVSPGRAIRLSGENLSNLLLHSLLISDGLKNDAYLTWSAGSERARWVSFPLKQALSRSRPDALAIGTPWTELASRKDFRETVLRTWRLHRQGAWSLEGMTKELDRVRDENGLEGLEASDREEILAWLDARSKWLDAHLETWLEGFGNGA